MPITLLDAENKRELGTLTDEQFAKLRELLEEETEEDADYFISPDVVDFIEEEGADAELVKLLRAAVAGNEEGLEVTWRRS